MTGRRATITPEPVPAGEPSPQPVETAPAPDPSPAPPPPSPAEPEPQSTAEPTAEELDSRAPLTSRRRTLFGDADFPLSAGEAIAEVTRRIGAVRKEGRATGQGGGYAFRGIDHLLSALHPILGEVGLVILPGQVVREVWETRSTASGGTLNVARLLVRYTFVGPDGSELTAEAWGEAGDSGDKATQKAHSQSYKTLCFQTFSIPTEESAADEPDLTNEAARPFTAEEQERAARAYEAATGAATVEALAGVRRRALHLLPVPVRMVDETLVPLSVLFDRRLAELDAVPAQGDTGAGGSGGEQS